MKTILFTALVTVFFLSAVPSARAEAPPPPALHKAIYKMTMASTKSTSVISVGGNMYYDFIDSCDTWTTNQKFALNYEYADQPEAKLNSQFSSREGKKGESYDFAIRRTKDGVLQEEHQGNASRDADGSGSAHYAAPDGKDIKLPKGFLFPTQHTLKMVTEAMAGTKFFNAEMFDGSDGAGALEVNVVIGEAVKPPVDDKLAADTLLQSPAHKVRLAFYPPDNGSKQNDAESQPDYEMTMILHDNGVVSWMQIDYDQFSLIGELQAIEAAPPPKC